MRRLIREVSRKVAGTDRKPDAGEPADRDADILPLGGAALHRAWMWWPTRCCWCASRACG